MSARARHVTRLAHVTHVTRPSRALTGGPVSGVKSQRWQARVCRVPSRERISSLDVCVRARACADKRDFLGISVVGQSRDEGAGVCVGSIAEDGAVAADGRVRSGDVLIRVRRRAHPRHSFNARATTSQ